MQSIRRATKKYRGFLIAVVALLLVGLVGSFATWSSSGQSGGASGSTEPTMEQQITAYESYIASLKSEHVEGDYSGSISLAAAYLELAYLYDTQYSADIEDTAAHEASRAAALQAEGYYQQALDNAPESLNNAGLANIKAGLSEAREIQGDLEGALAYMEEACELEPDNVQLMVDKAVVMETMGDLEGALAIYKQASLLYPNDTQLLVKQALVMADMGDADGARALYMTARVLYPEDYTVAYAYASFLLFYDSAEAGLAEFQSYRDSLPEGHPDIAQADSTMEYLQAMATMFAGLGQGSEEDAAVDDGATEAPGE